MRQDIVAAATARQLAAINPAQHIYVSANAGTGKTRVLIQRLLALFLADPDLLPQNVLALTYTKAAATEMANRLREETQKLAALPEAERTPRLAELLGVDVARVTPAHHAMALTLYSRLFEATPAVSISTIHAWCQQVLQRFPLEAGLIPAFRVLEGVERDEMLDQALNQTIGEYPELTGPVAQLGAHLADQTVRTALSDVVGSPMTYRLLFSKQGGSEGVIAHAAQQLNVPVDLTNQQLVEKINAARQALVPELKDLARNLGAGSGSNAQTAAALLAEWLALPPAEQPGQWTHYVEPALLTKELEPKRTIGKDFAEQLQPIQEALLDLLEQEAAGRTFLLSKAYLTLAERTLENYETLKFKAGYIDFDDLLSRTAELLANDAIGQWVSYRLDAELKHFLLDEGQDIDPVQHRIIDQLTKEFFTGTGQHSGQRTLFAVGDLKQSIYRFRGARPDVFAALGEQIEAAPEAAAVPLQTSFRSSAAVLEAADQICAPLVADLGVSEYHPHAAAQSYPGVVEVWPLFKPEQVAKKEPPSSWQLPERKPVEPIPMQRMADKIADHCAALLSSNLPLACRDNRAISAGDILILFRSRGPVMQAVMRALNQRGLTHTGADKFDLKTTNLGQDMLALGQWVLAPHDDVKLAQVLRSPLFGWHEEQLAAASSAPTLAEGVQQVNAEDAARLAAFQHSAHRLTPQAFYQQVFDLTAARGAYFITVAAGRDDYPQSLGDEIADAWLAFAGNQPDMATLCRRFERFGHNVAREVGAGLGAIRLQTVHSAKGLEAPIVILAETAKSVTSISNNEKVMWDKSADSENNACYYRSGTRKKAALITKLEEVEQAALQQDEARLLYVALTRAEERLYITGALAANSKKLPEPSWYSWVMQAAKNWPKDEAGNHVHSYGSWQSGATSGTKTSPAAELTFNPALARPSSAVHLVAQQAEAAQFGEAVHKMLEVLPDVPAEERQARAAHIARLWQLSAVQTTAAINQVEACLVAFPELFIPQRQAEVSLLHNGRELRLDLLVEDSAGALCIIDFKTDKSTVDPAAKMPHLYREQLSSYLKVLAALYPERHLKAGLLYTAAETPQMVWYKD